MTRTIAQLRTMAAAMATAGAGQSFTVIRNGESITFMSYLMDNAVLDALKLCKGNNFAISLYEASFNSRGLSPTQLAWAHKLVNDLISEPEAESPQVVDNRFDRLFTVFNTLRLKGAKRMKMRFSGIMISPSKSGEQLYVCSLTETEVGRFGTQPKYLGKVTKTGLDSRLSDDVKAVIMAAADDPLTAAIKYGKESGNCSCCGRELTDPASIEAGIGPVCRDKFGL